MSFSALLIPLIIGGIIPGWLSVYIWRGRKAKGAKPLAIMMLLLFLWSNIYILELACTNFPSKVFLGRVRHVFVAFTPVAWVIFSIEYTNKDHWLTPLRRKLLLVIPLLTSLITFIPAISAWFYAPVGMIHDGQLLLLKVEKGWWYWRVHTVYSYTGMLIGMILLTRALLKWNRQYRGQMIWSLLAISAPWIANIITIFQILPIHIDLTPFAFSITGLGLAFAVVHHRMLDLAPIAREMVVDGLQDGVLILDSANRVVDANHAASTLLSAQTELVGKSIEHIFAHWPDIAQRDLVAEEGQEEIELLDQQGQLRHLEISFVPLYDRYQAAAGGVATIRDITQIKEAQAFLLDAHNKAVEANQLKTRFLAKVSHEFRTPLSDIIGYGELLEKENFGPLNEKQKSIVLSMRNSAQHLNEMVMELLDQAQIESDTLVLKNAPLTLSALMESSLADFAALVEEKGLLLNASIDPNLPLRLVGDALRLRQIIVNLVANALKFTLKGDVNVSFLLENDTHWTLTVTDTGVGISEEDLADIFTPKVSTELSYKNRGIGLGLSITRDLISLMDGSISVHSELDQGTEFRVTLPLMQVE